MVFNPVSILRDSGVDSGVSGGGTSVTPADDTDLFASHVDHGATAVTLAGVLALAAGADHAISDGRRSISILAGCFIDEWNSDLLQNAGQASSRLDKKKLDH